MSEPAGEDKGVAPRVHVERDSVARRVAERERDAEEALRASEARQAYLLALSDALRPHADPVAIQGEAARLLGEQFKANRALYAEFDGDMVFIHRDWVRGVPSMAGRYPASVWGDYIAIYLRGEPYVVSDVATDPQLDDASRTVCRTAEIAAFVGVGLVKGRKLVGALGVQSMVPRAWTAEEIELVRETAERTWEAVERARAEAALRASEAKYRTIFDSIDEGFSTLEVLYDDAGRPADLLYREINPAFERHTGVSGCVGRTVRDILPTVEDAWIETYARVARTGESMRFDRYNESTRRWFSTYMSRVGGDGSPLVASVFNDITERKLAEAALTAAAARDAFLVRLADALRPLADAAAMQAEAARVLGEHLGVNHAHYGEATGNAVVVHHSYAKGRPPMVGTFDLAREGWGARLLDTYRAGRTAVCYDVHTDPTITPVEVAVLSGAGFGAYVGVPLVKEGEWVALLAVETIAPREWTADEIALVEDVAERTWAAVQHARAEAALRKSELRLQQAVAATGLGVFEWDVATDRLSVNAHFRAMFGLPPEEQILVGAMMTAQVHPDDRPLVEAQIAAAFHPDSSGSYEVEHRATTPKGLRWFRASGQVSFEGEARHPVRLVGVIQDITERRVADDALRASLESAEAGNRAKSEFLAVMSHELRTPLNAIGGYAELVELGIHGPVTDAQRTALARIQASQRHLLGLIAGVLDYSRVEAGAVRYQIQNVPVTEAVAEAETLVAPQLRAKGLGYSWSGAPPGLAVRADREKLQQILLNLMSNAIKFTQPRDGGLGRIEVSCTVDETDVGWGTGRVHLHVRDTGEGIAADHLERIFEPFVQVDQRLTRTHAGVGLGLAISRDLARGMGGGLTVRSEAGIGSVFTLTLPASDSA